MLFAGTTVCIAILGLIALGVSFFNGMAVATALAVGFTMAASLTLLPALLSLFGLKVCRASSAPPCAPAQFIADSPDRAAGLAGRNSSPAAASPVAVGSGALIVVLAIPFFSLQLGASDQGSDPKGSTTRTATT